MRRFTQALAALVLLATLGVVAVSWMTWIPPRWWSPPDAADTRVQEVAWAMERSLVEEAQRIRPPDEPWSIRLHESTINAWLSARLPEWVAHETAVEWPGDLVGSQVQFTPEGVDLAAAVRERGRTRIINLRVMPALEAGRLVLRPEHALVGSLPLPEAIVQSVLLTLRDAVGNEPAIDAAAVDRAVEVLAGRSSIEAILPLVDDRRVEILDLHCGEGELVVKCRTMPPAARDRETAAR